LSAHRFVLRLLLNLLIACLIIGLSLLGGIWGYEHFERSETTGQLSGSDQAACSACHSKSPTDHVFSRIRP